MRVFGKVLIWLGVAAGLGLGLAMLLGIAPAGVTGLAAIGLVKLALMAAVGLIGAGTVLGKIAGRREFRERIEAGRGGRDTPSLTRGDGGEDGESGT